MRVVTVRYEGVKVYSTSRKALESVADKGWNAFIETEYDGDGKIVGSKMMAVTTKNIAKLIMHLNAKEFLTLYSEDDRETCDVVKTEVL
jgi:hypothetical protein